MPFFIVFIVIFIGDHSIIMFTLRGGGGFGKYKKKGEQREGVVKSEPSDFKRF